jgi:hypothetical protein
VEGAEAAAAVRRLVDVVTGSPEQLRHELPDVRVVVHDEDPSPAHTVFIPTSGPVPYPHGRELERGTSPDQRTSS